MDAPATTNGAAPQNSAAGTTRGTFESNQPLSAGAAVEIGLSAAIITVRDDEPEVLTLPAGGAGHLPNQLKPPLPALPSGPYDPGKHSSLDAGLRAWVEYQTGLDLNYVEQLCTVAGTSVPHRQPAESGFNHTISVGYFALVRPEASSQIMEGASWLSWYEFLPWEDWRDGKPAILTDTIEPLLEEWAGENDFVADTAAAGAHGATDGRADRLHIAFGMDGGSWDEEKVLERFSILAEAGLIAEEAATEDLVGDWNGRRHPKLGQPLAISQRRLLATAIGRVRGKIKYRPVIFELMPDEFTLFELQKTVEAILGPHLHKQNFRRLVESAGLVEATGEVRVKTGGRPARLYRFRRQVLLERPSPGVRVNLGRNLS